MQDVLGNISDIKSTPVKVNVTLSRSRHAGAKGREKI
jgi:hypothetical protein